MRERERERGGEREREGERERKGRPGGLRRGRVGDKCNTPCQGNNAQGRLAGGGTSTQQTQHHSWQASIVQPVMCKFSNEKQNHN